MRIYEKLKKIYNEESKQISNELEYFEFPIQFRNQCCNILYNCIGNHEGLWNYICSNVANENGLLKIESKFHINNRFAFNYYMQNCSNEVFLKSLRTVWIILHEDKIASYLGDNLDEANKELNFRFKESNLGYEIINNGFILKLNNKFIHENVIKDCLNLLNDSKFEIANKYFLEGQSKIVSGNFDDSIISIIKSFESFIKVLCTELKYKFNQTDNLNRLFNVLKENNFYPKYLISHFNSLISVLECGANVVRNKTAAHGQTIDIRLTTNDCLFVLNVVASDILYLEGIYKTKIVK